MNWQNEENATYPPDCNDNKCGKCYKCYKNYVEAKMSGELD